MRHKKIILSGILFSGSELTGLYAQKTILASEMYAQFVSF